ncbi:MAG: acyltransferase [Holophagaceae bacterium]|nr:acyltransferase [Holophagaceae bacterium]
MALLEAGLRGDSSNLDLLRAFAVLFVVISHLPLAMAFTTGTGFHLGALGFYGVMLFFVHTCLVLMLSIQRQISIRGRDHLAADFFIRRAFRIYPLSCVVVLACIGVILLAGSAAFLGRPDPGWGLTLSNLFLVQNLTGQDSVPPPLWSLPFEVQMYLLLPGLFLLVEKSGRKAPLLVCALWLGAVAVIWLLSRIGISYEVIKYFPCFIPGILAFCLRGVRRRLSPIYLYAYVFGTALILLRVIKHGQDATMAAWPMCLGLGMIIPNCRELELAWLKWISKMVARYSYGIYLVHGVSMHLAFTILKASNPILQWACFLGTLVPMVGAAYHFIEKPGIDLGARVASRWSQGRLSTRVPRPV